MAWRSQTSDTASENNFNLYENLPPSPSLFSAQDDSLQLEGLENDFQVLRLSTTTTSPSEDVKYKPIPPLWGPNNLPYARNPSGIDAYSFQNQFHPNDILPYSNIYRNDQYERMMNRYQHLANAKDSRMQAQINHLQRREVERTIDSVIKGFEIETVVPRIRPEPIIEYPTTVLQTVTPTAELSTTSPTTQLPTAAPIAELPTVSPTVRLPTPAELPREFVQESLIEPFHSNKSHSKRLSSPVAMPPIEYAPLTETNFNAILTPKSTMMNQLPLRNGSTALRSKNWRNTKVFFDTPEPKIVSTPKAWRTVKVNADDQENVTPSKPSTVVRGTPRGKAGSTIPNLNRDTPRPPRA